MATAKPPTPYMSQVAASTTLPSPSRSNPLAAPVVHNPPEREGGTKFVEGLPPRPVSFFDI
ncbi:hypothetical protein KIN20_035613 [Parelaphostrongylus tenuis]|uniref:Uncharacterized protein n=1 Tax=Parelaphostrongylus tenuis TaxID=148309 RepID=A0AAD5WL03_PARTN|nr:hypothetical protein KIN20_035613 [Parelaphostrongylus tenuis]